MDNLLLIDYHNFHMDGQRLSAVRKGMAHSYIEAKVNNILDYDWNLKSVDLLKYLDSNKLPLCSVTIWGKPFDVENLISYAASKKIKLDIRSDIDQVTIASEVTYDVIQCQMFGKHDLRLIVVAYHKGYSKVFDFALDWYRSFIPMYWSDVVQQPLWGYRSLDHLLGS